MTILMRRINRKCIQLKQKSKRNANHRLDMMFILIILMCPMEISKAEIWGLIRERISYV